MRTGILFRAHRRFYLNLTDDETNKNAHNTRADLRVSRYYTPTVTRHALHFLAPDYRRLRLPVPSWALALLGATKVNMILYSREANQSMMDRAPGI